MRSDSALNFTAYILSVLLIAISTIIFIALNPQYMSSIWIALSASMILLIIILALALITMLPLILLTTSSIIVLVLLFRHWLEPLPQVVEVINRILLASILTVPIFIFLVSSVYKGCCIEPFLRRNLDPPETIFKDFLRRKAPKLIKLEIIGLVAIIILITVLDPSVSQIIGGLQPGYGLQDLMKIYPSIGNYLVAILAGIGVITSLYGQLEYIKITRNLLIEKCYNKYKETLYDEYELKENEKCVLSILSATKFSDIRSFCDSVCKRCNMSYTDCIDEIRVICRNDIVSEIISEFIEIDEYLDYICEKDKLYVNLTNLCKEHSSQHLPQTLKRASEKCNKYKRPIRKLLQRIKIYMYSAPFILIPIVIAIL